MDDRNTRIIGRGRYVRLLSKDGYEFVQRLHISGIVGILALTDDGKIILTEQFRPPVGARVIELPAGLAGDRAGAENEDLAAAAHRELLEETGYEADEMIFLTRCPPSPGLSDEVITFFRARGLKKIGPGGGDESEDIVIHEVPLAEVHHWLGNISRPKNILIDAKVYTGLYFANL